MSTDKPTFETVDVVEQVGGTPTFCRPDGWTLSTPWQRAQTETDRGGPLTDAERMVWLSDGNPHRVIWALRRQSLIADCDCEGHHYSGGWCAHVASLWWRWTRGRIDVIHLDTGRRYPEPPTWLRLDDDRDDDLEALTPAELDAYHTCQLGSVGVREYADLTGRSPGTLGNLLRRARDAVEGGQR